MNQKEILQKTHEKIKALFKSEGSGHDYWHLVRVVNNAKKINETENGDDFLIELAAWTHDLGDYKLNDGKDKSKEMISEFLNDLTVDDSAIQQVLTIVSEVSFKGGLNKPPSSLEAKIVQDADRLDAIGAIGIARTFMYGGSKGRLIYDPEIPPVEHLTKESYQKSTAPTINHFYEKLLKLKDLMNTKTAKKIAEQRHSYMEGFLKQFFREVS